MFNPCGLHVLFSCVFTRKESCLLFNSIANMIVIARVACHCTPIYPEIEVKNIQKKHKLLLNNSFRFFADTINSILVLYYSCCHWVRCVAKSAADVFSLIHHNSEIFPSISARCLHTGCYL